MAKKKAKAKMKMKSATPTREEAVRFRMTADFKAWLEEFAATRQTTTADVLTHGVMALAKIEGFKPPPRR